MTTAGKTDARNGTRDPYLVLSGLTLANPHVGQGVYTLRLVEGLVRQFERDFLVVAPSTIQRPSQLPARNFLHMPLFRAPSNPLISYVIASERLLRFVRRNFPNAIFHSPGPILGSTKPARTVVTLHDCIYRHFANYNGRFFLRRLLMEGTERFASGARLVLTDSEFSRQDLTFRTRVPAEKIEVLYPWVGNEFLEPVGAGMVEGLRQRLDLPERFWLYVGGYDFRKNVEFLIDAYAAANRRKRLPPLLLAGKIPARRDIATCDVNGALTRNGLTEREVIRVGLVEPNDLRILYRSARLLIFPSLGEGFGLPPAEAIAIGTPVLTSNRTSLPEVVPNPHCMFGPDDLAGLVEKLIAAEESEKQFSAELSASFTEKYAIDRYLKLLHRVH